MAVLFRLTGQFDVKWNRSSGVEVHHFQLDDDHIVGLLLDVQCGGKLRRMSASHERDQKQRSQYLQRSFLPIMSKGIAASCAIVAKPTAATSDLP